MASYNIEMNMLNETGSYDLLYPKVKVEYTDLQTVNIDKMIKFDKYGFDYGAPVFLTLTEYFKVALTTTPVSFKVNYDTLFLLGDNNKEINYYVRGLIITAPVNNITLIGKTANFESGTTTKLATNDSVVYFNYSVTYYPIGDTSVGSFETNSYRSFYGKVDSGTGNLSIRPLYIRNGYM